jgi:hypothetical protein
MFREEVFALFRFTDNCELIAFPRGLEILHMICPM